MSPRKRPRQIVERNRIDDIKLPQKDNMDGFQILMVVVFFISSGITLHFFISLDLNLLELVKFYCLFLGLSFFLPISIYRKKFTMSIYEYLIFNFITFSPLILASTFLINSTFKSSIYSETYRIIDSQHSEIRSIYILENDAYEDREFLRSINGKDVVEINGQHFFTIYFSDGLFGIRIVESKELH